MKHQGAAPGKRLASYYFAHYAAVGAIVPFLPLYLHGLGFRADDIGFAIAVIAIVRIFTPTLWGRLVDHHGHRLAIMRGCAVGALICFAALPWVHTLWPLIAVLASFALFWNAGLPQLEALTMEHLRDRPARYGIIRSGGAAGFIVTVLGLGALLDYTGDMAIPVWVLVTLALTLLASFSLHEAPVAQASATVQRLRHVLRQRPVLVLLVVTFLMQLSHGPYYTFFSLYLEGHGYRAMSIGALWSFGVICEIGLFFSLGLLRHRWHAQTLLYVALIATVLRWVLTSMFVENLPILLFAQAMHLFSFALFHYLLVEQVQQLFPARLRGQGQALYSSIGFGAGGALGAWLSGQLWVHYSPSSIFLFATVCAALALLVAVIGLKNHPLTNATTLP